MEPRSQAKKLMFPRADVSTAGRAVRTAIMGRFPCARGADPERVERDGSGVDTERLSMLEGCGSHSELD